MKLLRKIGVTSEIWQVFIRDSSSTTGAGLTGLTNASSGLTAYYHRDTDTTATAISLVSMTVGTFTSSGFKEIDATNMPGWYQFCPPNAALASGAKSCAIHLKGATNMAPLPLEVQLVAYDPEDTVRLGLTALPNAAAEAAGGLYTRGTGAGQIAQTNNGTIDTRLADAVSHGGTLGSSTATLALSRVNVTSQTSNTSAITATGNGTGHGAALTSGSGATGNALTLLAASTNGHGLKSTGTGTGDGAELTAGAGGADLDADVTGNVTGNLSGSVGSVTGAVGSVTGNVGGNVTGSVGSLAAQAKADVNAEADTALADIHLDHLIAVADPGGVVANSSFLAKLVSKSATPAFSSYDNTTESLEAIRDRGDSAWITATGFSTLDAAGVRSAVGLASANLDTQLGAIDDYIDTEVAAIKAKTDNLPASFPSNFASLAITAGGAVTAGTVGDKTGFSLAAAGLDSVVVETSLNARQALSIIAASGAGALTGADTGSIVIKGAGVATTRITGTGDASGNRSTVTLSPPA